MLLLDWISDKVKEEETRCCSGRQAMRIHGGGQAISAPNSQNGSTTTSKVIIYCFHLLYYTFLSFYTSSHVEERDRLVDSSTMIRELYAASHLCDCCFCITNIVISE